MQSSNSSSSLLPSHLRRQKEAFGAIRKKGRAQYQVNKRGISSPAKRADMVPFIKSIARGVARGETETKDFAVSVLDTYSTVGTFTYLNDIDEGVSTYQRIGDKILGVSLDLRYQLTALGDTNNTYRVIIFTWNSGTPPSAATDILEATAASYVCLSEYQHDRQVKFKVLYDEVHTHTSVASPVGSVVAKQIPLNINFDYSGVNGTDYGTRSLWAFVCSDSAAATHPAVTFRSVFYYKDA